MRAELPWNVAGIPPEAREAARAAARREGLSVGEWLTRRILRSFSDLAEDQGTGAAYERAAERAPLDQPGLTHPSLDAWGLPTPPDRSDTEEMLSRVSRTEEEASGAFRRIEEHLRNVQRRLDTAERSQSENNRAMSKTATEINLATREQAQAFDLLGGHVMNLGERLERLERNTAQDGLKEAVKALHQGLSRLADQITQTANQSAQQISTLSDGLEQLAARLAQVRIEVETTAQRLEARLAAAEEDARNRFAAAEEDARQRFAAAEEEASLRFAAFEAETQRTLDQRLAAVEKASQVNTNALDHALERLEAQAVIRADDQTELQRRHAEIEGAISNLEEAVQQRHGEIGGAISNLEGAVQQRHGEIGGAISNLENAVQQRHGEIGGAISNLENAVQQRHGEIGGAISNLEEAVQRLEARGPDTGLERRLESIERALDGLANRLEVHNPSAGLEDSLRGMARRIETVEKNIETAEKNHGELLEELRANRASAARPAMPALAPEPPPYDASIFAPKETVRIDPPPPKSLFEEHSFAEILAEPSPDEDHAGADENFLAIARRSARAAAEAEANKSTGFSWNAGWAEGDERRRFLIPAILGTVLLAALAGFALSQKFRASHIAPAPAVRSSAPLTPAPSPVSPPTGKQSLPQTVPPARTPIPSPPQLKSSGPVPTLDRVTQLANGGNAIAQTIIGIKELDGDGVPANPADAVKWLQRAADQGQAVAQYRLGAAYERGQGVGANGALAAHWYQLAATQGNRKAMHNLAVAYASGTAGKKDMAEAARWFAKAAALGLADSQFNLAVLYERGEGATQSLLDAYKWYGIAASQGDAESKSRMEVLAPELSDDDRNAARKSAASFRPAPLSRTANVPPEMADLAGN